MYERCLTTSTASRIKRFQEKYGKLFGLLYTVVKQQESCNPDQSIEPCTEKPESGKLLDNPVVPEDSRVEKSTGKEKGEKLSIPKKQASKRSCAMKELKNVGVPAIEECDKTDNLIKYFREENEQARQHELQLLQMLPAVNTSQLIM